MTAYQVPAGIIEFYSATINESDRLSGPADGVLEMVRTQELLRRHLPPAPASVLDVGGGPGAHARWLSEDGYRVHLVDPVQRHLAEAEDSGCSVELGDARELSAADASYDVVLVLGPLYHLVEAADRRTALAEAYRVVRPGGSSPPPASTATPRSSSTPHSPTSTATRSRRASPGSWTPDLTTGRRASPRPTSIRVPS